MKTINEIASVFASVVYNHDTDEFIAALEAAGVTDDILLAYGLAVCGNKLVVEAATREAVVAVAGATAVLAVEFALESALERLANAVTAHLGNGISIATLNELCDAEDAALAALQLSRGAK